MNRKLVSGGRAEHSSHICACTKRRGLAAVFFFRSCLYRRHKRAPCMMRPSLEILKR